MQKQETRVTITETEVEERIRKLEIRETPPKYNVNNEPLECEKHNLL